MGNMVPLMLKMICI